MNFQALITLVFFIAFIALVVWVYRPSRTKDYEKL
ncbi:MAG: CcoQ/FixQ family Cbb3-type cytochrome c oxidase assembly chaperone [Pseudomonadota bacterium]|nr:CcoQ/FixQ family Cbb3-type cytochrome c oxidase assembly chaperone [Pseudomonadota bacterium]